MPGYILINIYTMFIKMILNETRLLYSSLQISMNVDSFPLSRSTTPKEKTYEEGKNHVCSNSFMKFTYAVSYGWLNINLVRRLQHLSSQTTYVKMKHIPLWLKLF